jgi:hypothetical protein
MTSVEKHAAAAEFTAFHRLYDAGDFPEALRLLDALGLLRQRGLVTYFRARSEPWPRPVGLRPRLATIALCHPPPNPRVANQLPSARQCQSRWCQTVPAVANFTRSAVTKWWVGGSQHEQSPQRAPTNSVRLAASIQVPESDTEPVKM